MLRQLKKLRHLRKFILGYGFENAHQNGEYRLYGRMLKKKSIILEVGTYLGYHVEQYLKANPQNEIYAFEPVQYNFNSLIAKFGQIKNVTIENAAIGDKEGIIQLFAYHGVSSIYQNEFHVQNKDTQVIEAPQVTIDGYLKQKKISHVDFMKVDVEGGELKVLQGAKESIKSKSIKRIQFEFGMNKEYSFQDLFDLFINEGYSMYRIAYWGLYPIRKYSPKLEKLSGNYIAINR